MTDGDKTGTKETEQEKLRREAYALGWDKLTETQQRAFERIIRGLASALYNIKKHETQDIRSNQILFLSGQRGMGKTTLMLSVRDAFGKPDGRKCSTSSGKIDTSIHECIHKIRDRIVWLEPIDMDPMPSTSHLLAAVLARIEASAKPPEDREGGLLDRRPDDERALLKLNALQSDVVMAWEGNLAQRATALDPEVYAIEARKSERAKLRLSERLNTALKEVSALRARRERCEDDTQLFVLPVDDFDMNPCRAIELLKLIRFVAVPRLFTLILGDIGLAEEMLYYQMIGEIAQLKGSRSNLPSISSERALAAASMRKLIPPTQRIELESMELDAAKAYPKKKGEACEDSLGNLLEKIGYSFLGLPREEIESKENGNADSNKPKDETPPGTNGNDKTTQTSKPANGLPDDKKGIHPKVFGEKIKSLRAFLFFPDVIQKIESTDSSDEKVPKYGYDGLEILLAPSRHVADIWHALRRLNTELTKEKLHVAQLPTIRQQIARDRHVLDVFANELRKAIDEDLNLGYEARQALFRSVAKNPLEDEWELNTDVIRVEAHLSRAMRLKPERKPVHQDASNSSGDDQARKLFCEISSHRMLRWDVYADPKRLTKKGKKSRGGEVLSGRTRAALILFHDLLQLSDAGVVSGELQDDRLKDRTYTEWHDGISPEPMKIEWFEEIWTTFWEANIFMRLWNRGQLTVRELRQNPSVSDDNELLRHLAYVWIASGVTVLGAKQDRIQLLLEKALFASEKQADGRHGLVELQWEQLTEIVNILAEDCLELRNNHQDDRRTADIEKWFINFACLMAPETGIPWKKEKEKGASEDPKDPRSFFLDAHHIKSLFSKVDIHRSIKRHRLKRLGPYAHSSVGVALLCTNAMSQQLNSSSEIDSRISQFHVPISNDVFNEFAVGNVHVFSPNFSELRDWSPTTTDDTSKPSDKDIELVKAFLGEMAKKEFQEKKINPGGSEEANGNEGDKETAPSPKK